MEENNETLKDQPIPEKGTDSNMPFKNQKNRAAIVFVAICLVLVPVFVFIFFAFSNNDNIPETVNPVYTPTPSLYVEPTESDQEVTEEEVSEDFELELKVIRNEPISLTGKICFSDTLEDSVPPTTYVRCSDPLTRNIEDVLEAPDTDRIEVRIVSGKILITQRDGEYYIYDPESNKILGKEVLHDDSFAYQIEFIDIDTVYTLNHVEDDNSEDGSQQIAITKWNKGVRQYVQKLDGVIEGRGLGIKDVNSLKVSPDGRHLFLLSSWMWFPDEPDYTPKLYIITENDSGQEVKMVNDVLFATWRDNNSLWLQQEGTKDFGIYEIISGTFSKKIEGDDLEMIIGGRKINNLLVFISYIDNSIAEVHSIDLNSMDHKLIYGTSNDSVPLANIGGNLLIVEYKEIYTGNPFLNPELVNLRLLDPSTGEILDSVNTSKVNVEELIYSVSLDFGDSRNPGFIPSFWSD